MNFIFALSTDGNEDKQSEEEEEESQSGESKQVDTAGIFILDVLTQLQKKTLVNRVEPLLQVSSAFLVNNQSDYYCDLTLI